jgi:excisionase family DNA binding protein
MEKEELLTVPEAARLLRISERNAYELVNTGRLPAIRISPKRWIVPRKAIDRLLDPEAAPMA